MSVRGSPVITGDCQGFLKHLDMALGQQTESLSWTERPSYHSAYLIEFCLIVILVIAPI